jgi:undecaprenyl-diphosphatase
MTLIEAIILAIVEGLTEFLPVSSTGHMILASAFMGINENEFTKVFTVNIQFGTILSVVVLYWKRFFNTIDFYLKLVVAVVPILMLGYIFRDNIDSLLGNVYVVAVMLIVGGVILLFVDSWFKKSTEENYNLSYQRSFIIGLFQCLALVPGVSRSAATIIGGMTQRLNRKAAAEFAFFLTVPTMFAASSYKLLKSYSTITSDQVNLLVVGNIVGFLVAMIAIKFFITYLTKYGFKIFGYYRIILGGIILALLVAGVDLKIQ